MSYAAPKIRFAYGQFAALRERLLSDLSKEAFAIILAKRNVTFPDLYCTISVRFPDESDIISRSIGHVTPTKEYIYDVLAELIDRHDVDTIIDVHTHPFSANAVHFSSIDDDDERTFFAFLADRFPDVHYGSIVLGQHCHDARIWNKDDKGLIKDTKAELLPASDSGLATSAEKSDPALARAELAIGIDAMRKIAQTEKVAIFGVGGLGSIVAENLVQMGFSNLVIVDPDVVELSNLGRLVGAKESDARYRRRKVTTLKRHLNGLNSNVSVLALPFKVQDKRVLQHIMDCTWLIVCTDNHSSRYAAQQISHDFFIPLISAGVNITVAEGVVTDVSGEVINCKIGCGYCLLCLGRINHMKMIVEAQPESAEGHGLVSKGYVSGAAVAEPAVKTLNAIIASLTVDSLVNEFTLRQTTNPILVYESNSTPTIYQDCQTFERLDTGCASCLMAEQWD
jgi:molybdopterin-synthase adenylyltransferase